MRTEYKHTQTACPTCGHECDRADCIDKIDAPPVRGDISICINCGDILQFNDQLGLESATLNSLIDLDQEQHGLIERAQLEIRQRGRIEA